MRFVDYCIPRCIEWLNAIHTLEPGDIVATGTNQCGLSALQDGDVIELETDGEAANHGSRYAETCVASGDET